MLLYEYKYDIINLVEQHPTIGEIMLLDDNPVVGQEVKEAAPPTTPSPYDWAADPDARADLGLPRHPIRRREGRFKPEDLILPPRPSRR